MWLWLQTLLFQAVMDTKAECSEVIKKLGELKCRLVIQA